MTKKSQRYSMCILVLLGALLGSPSGADTTANLTDLKTQVSALNSAIDKLKNDSPAAFARLHAIIMQLQASIAQANPSGGALLVGPYLIAKNGMTVNYPISLIDGSLQPTGLQGDLMIPQGLTLVSVTAGPVAIGAGKSLVSHVQTDGSIRFLISGFNQTTIPSGVVANVQLSIPASTPAQLTSLTVASPRASDASGFALAISAISGTIRITL